MTMTGSSAFNRFSFSFTGGLVSRHKSAIIGGVMGVTGVSGVSGVAGVAGVAGVDGVAGPSQSEVAVETLVGVLTDEEVDCVGVVGGGLKGRQ